MKIIKLPITIEKRAKASFIIGIINLFFVCLFALEMIHWAMMNYPFFPTSILFANFEVLNNQNVLNISLLGALMPIFAIIGLKFGKDGIDSSRRTLAVTGFCLNFLSILIYIGLLLFLAKHPLDIF